MSDTGGFRVPPARLALGAVRNTKPDEEALALRVAPKLGVADAAARVAARGDPAAARAVDGDHDSILAGHPGLSRWMSDAKNAAIAHDDLPGLARTEDALTKLKDAGFFGKMAQAGEKGLRQLDASLLYAFAAEGRMSPEDAAAGIVAANRRIAELDAAAPADVTAQRAETDAAGKEVNAAVDELVAGIQRGDVRGFQSDVLGVAGKAAQQAGVFFSRPRAAAYSIAEQAANSLPALGLGAVGATAGPAGFAAGTFIGEGITEYGSWINEAVGNRQIDQTDPVAIADLLRDAGFMASVKSQARRKAVVTAAIDSLFSLYAGGAVAGATGKGKLLALAGETAVQTAGETASEAGGQAAATGKVDWGQAVLEGVSSLGQSVGEVGIGAIARHPVRAAREAVAKGLQAVHDVAAVREATEALAASPVTPRVPDRTAQAIEIMADGAPVDTVYVPVERWPVGMAGLPPVDIAKAQQTGQVAIPLPAFLQAAAADPAILDALEPDLRLRPGGMTLREATVALEQVSKDVEAAASETGPADEAEDEAAAAEIEARLGVPEGASLLFQAAQPEGGAPDVDQTSADAPSEAVPAGESPKQGGAPEASILRAAADAIEAVPARGVVGRIVGAVTGAQPVADAVRGTLAPTSAPAEQASPQAEIGSASGVATRPAGVDSVSALAAAAQRDPAGTAAALRELADIRDRQAKSPDAALRRRIEAEIRAAGRPAREAQAVARVLVAFVQTMRARFGVDVSDRVARFVRSAAPQGALEQTAYHASPHTFDAFSLHKIGTGQGAQMFGWGLYFSTAKEVHQRYMDEFAGDFTWKKGAAQNYSTDVFANAMSAVERKDGDVPAAIKSLRDIAAGLRKTGYPEPRWLPYDEAAAALSSGDIVKPKARSYTVDLAPAEDEYLLWDKPLSEQSEKVKKALRKIVATDPLGWTIKKAVAEMDAPPSRFRVEKRGRDFVVVGQGYEYSRFRSQEKADAEVARLDSAHKDNGELLYKMFGIPQRASEALAAAGIPGIKYLDGSSRGKGEGSYNYVIFDDKLVKITRMEQTGSRGAYDRLTRTIHVFESSDASTAVHETAHWIRDVMRQVPEAGEMLAEMEKAFGVEAGAEWTRAQEEKFAESFEAYILNGEAPSAGLRRAFATMRDVMLRVYRSIRELLGADKIDPRISAVFDRLLATDAEIYEAEREFGVDVPDEALSAMEQETADMLREAQQFAHDDARREAARARREQESDERDAARAEALEPIRAKVRAEVENSPANRALYALRDGTSPDGKPVPDPVKISRQNVVDAYGEQSAVVKRLESLGVLTGKGGIRIEAAAETFGFRSGDELAVALTGVADMDALVDRLASKRLAQERPDLVGRGDVMREAKKAVASEARSKALVAQLRALRKLARAESETQNVKAGQRADDDRRRAAFDGVPSIDRVRADAERILQPMRLRDIRPSVYLSAARRESNLSADRARVKDWPAAAQAKYRELLNHELYRMSRHVLDRVGVQQRRMVSFGNAGKQATLGRAGWTYQDQMNALLARFNFALIPLSKADQLKSLAEWVTANEKERADSGDDRPANIPPRILNDAFRTFWRDMTQAELADVVETADRIYHLAATKDDLLTIQAERKLSEQAAAVSAQAKSTAERITRDHSGTETPKEKRMRFVAASFGAIRKIGSLARMMDGFVDGGPLREMLVLPIEKALTRESVRRGKDGQALLSLHDGIGADRPAFTEKRMIAGLSLSREDVLGIAELWGSAAGRDRVLNNFPGDTKPTVQQIQAVLDTLTDTEIAYLEKKWAFWEQYWPEIVAQAKRLEGIAPEKVEHLPFTSAGRALPGGYAHLSYTGTGSSRLTAEDEANILKRTAGVRTQTRHGYEESRAAGVSRDLVIRLDIGVGFQHLQEVVHDLTLRETLLDVQRLLRHDDVKDAIIGHHGQATWDQFVTAYRDIAVADRGARDGFDQAIQRLRIGTTAAVLGLSLRTGVINLTGITQSMRRVGVGHVSRAIGRWLTSGEHQQATIEWVYSRSEFMRSRAADLNQIISEDRARIGKKRKAWQDMRWLIIEKTQLAVDMPTWLGAYERAISEGADDDRAVNLADEAVRDAQGSGQAVDLSAFQRDPNVWKKLFGTFYFFDSTRLQQTAEAVGEFRGSDRDAAAWAKLTSDMVLLYALPAALSIALTHAMVGGDDDPDDLAKELAAENASYLIGLVPVVRELNYVVKGYRGYEGPPGLRLITDVGKIVSDFADTDIEGAAQDINAAAGSVFGYPAAQINRTWRGLSAIQRGRARGARVVTAPIFGAPRR